MGDTGFGLNGINDMPLPGMNIMALIGGFNVFPAMRGSCGWSFGIPTLDNMGNMDGKDNRYSMNCIKYK